MEQAARTNDAVERMNEKHMGEFSSNTPNARADCRTRKLERNAHPCPLKGKRRGGREKEKEGGGRTPVYMSLIAELRARFGEGCQEA